MASGDLSPEEQQQLDEQRLEYFVHVFATLLSYYTNNAKGDDFDEALVKAGEVYLEALLGDTPTDASDEHSSPL